MTTQTDFQILALESAIEVLRNQIDELRGGSRVSHTSAKTDETIGKKRGRKPGTVMSAEARLRIQAAQKKRWALAKAATAGAAEEVPAPVEEPVEPVASPRPGRPKKKRA